jgi:hypothetical protein
MEASFPFFFFPSQSFLFLASPYPITQKTIGCRQYQNHQKFELI